MTTDKLLAALKAWIESRDDSDLDGVTIHLRDTEQEKEPPFILIRESATEEHPVLRGVLAIDVEAILVTVPGNDAQEAESLATHQLKADALYEILADKSAITYCDGYPGLKVFDIRGCAPTTESEDQTRQTRFELRAVASKTV